MPAPKAEIAAKPIASKQVYVPAPAAPERVYAPAPPKQVAPLVLHEEEAKETRSWLSRLGLGKQAASVKLPSEPAPYEPAPAPESRPSRPQPAPEPEPLDFTKPRPSLLEILKERERKAKRPEVQSKPKSGVLGAMGKWSANLEVGRAPSSTAPRMVLPEAQAARASQPAFLTSSKSAVVSLPKMESEALSAARPSTQPMAAYPPADAAEPAEWDSAYAQELSRPAPSSADSEAYYVTATWEQKKFLYALGAEVAYWRMRGGNPGTAAQARDEKEFLSILETASPEQRLAIELCINLTKALQALMLAASPDSEGVSANRARAVYQQIVAERPDICPILYYRLSRLALQRSYTKGSPNPSSGYLSFISKLDEPALVAVFAMRAAFFDRLMNDQSSSMALRGAAAEHYSRLLLGRPGIEPFLQQYLKVREGISLFLAEPNASVLEDPRTHPHGWLQVLNEDEVTRTILHYELAAIFFRPEHRVLLQTPAAEEPAEGEGAAPLSIAPAPGPLEPKLREQPELATEAQHGRVWKSAARRRRAKHQVRPQASSHAHSSHPSVHHHAGPSNSSQSRSSHPHKKRH